jgi:hypothetical protein
MSTDGGSQILTTSPDGSGGSSTQGGDTGGKNVPGQIPVELRAAAENLGIKLVPEKDWAESQRLVGSLQHGNVAKKLAEYDKYVEADQKRKDGELSDLERATGNVKTLEGDKESLAARNRELALCVGFLTENAKRAVPDSKDVAVFPEIMDLHMPTLLAEFKGGNADEFVQNGLEKLLELQGRFARRFGGPGNAPGGGSLVSPSGAHSEPAPRRDGSVVKQMADWRKDAAFTTNPRIVSPTGDGRKR